MNTPITDDAVKNKSVSDSADWLVRPFIRWGDGYYGLCVQAGVVTESPDQNKAWTEYHLEYRGGDIWELEVCPHENTGWTVWRGKIPTREIFQVVMTHTENAPSIDWSNATDDGQRRDALTILAEHESRYQTDGFRALIASIRHDIISSQTSKVSDAGSGDSSKIISSGGL